MDLLAQITANSSRKKMKLKISIFSRRRRLSFLDKLHYDANYQIALRYLLFIRKHIHTDLYRILQSLVKKFFDLRHSFTGNLLMSSEIFAIFIALCNRRVSERTVCIKETTIAL
jgi:hypothetical protein